MSPENTDTRKDYRKSGDDRRAPYRKNGHDDHRRRGPGGRDRRDGDRGDRRPRRDDRYRDDDRGERYAPRRDFKDDPHGKDCRNKPREKDLRQRQDFKGHGAPRDDHRDFKDKPRGRDFRNKPREKDFRQRQDFKGHGAPRDDRRTRSTAEERPSDRQDATLTIPSTPQRILFKGVDCEVTGRKDLAMVLYLHGAAKMSRGCENNALRMLREMGPKEFSTVRGRVAKSCPEDAMIAFDYLCATLDDGYDRSGLDSAAETGNCLAIYYRIRMEEVEGDDPCIDVFASSSDEKMVEDGLKLLVRKKDSARAEELLRELEHRRKLRQSIRTEFIRAIRDDSSSRRRLEELSTTFPEARYLLGYLDTSDREEYLRDGMPEYGDIILSMAHELGISDTPFGKYLSAMKLRSDGEEWIPAMVSAAASGSDEAMVELGPVQTRRDVRKGLCSIYLTRGDMAGLIKCYDGEDASYLERFCAGDPARMIEVGKHIGGSREVDWLRKCCLDGSMECRDALVAIASVESRRNKQLIYALHDVGADLDAAKLYFDMYGDPALPAVKWLAKVCEDEDAREYVRSRFEEMGDLRTFDSIFVDDGYRKRDVRNRRTR